jgi:hypothetical protein
MPLGDGTGPNWVTQLSGSKQNNPGFGNRSGNAHGRRSGQKMKKGLARARGRCQSNGSGMGIQHNHFNDELRYIEQLQKEVALLKEELSLNNKSQLGTQAQER